MEQKNDSVPYIVHEGIMARMERTIRRLWITVILLIVFLVGSNIAWLVYESQFQTVQQTEVKQDTSGGNYNKLVGISTDGKADSKAR